MSSPIKEEISKTTEKFYFKLLTMENLTEVENLIAKHFSPRTQLSNALKIPLSKAVLFHKYRVKLFLQQNVSIGAFEAKSRKLVGAVFGSILRKGEKSPDHDDKNRIQDIFPISAPIRRLMENLGVGNLFDLIKAEKIFLSSMLTVDIEYSNAGLGNRLHMKANKLARSLECDCIVGIPSSSYAHKISKRNGDIIVRSIDLRHYIDQVTGDNPFKNVKPPHHLISITYSRLVKPSL
uniref:N-acetyltransferase domain-containing protein n=1 Tax=Ciona savignyi TaxID=51511 RepID=H2Z1G2_CIOSA